MDYDAQPRATYCRPEIASVGLTEQQCEERGLPIKVAKVPFQAIAKALIGGEYEGFAKVIAQQGDRRHARHPHHRPACDRPHRRGVARASTSTRRRGRSALSTHAHPTLSEILGETAMAVDGRSINF